jgi:hypothetical protein
VNTTALFVPVVHLTLTSAFLGTMIAGSNSILKDPPEEDAVRQATSCHYANSGFISMTALSSLGKVSIVKSA